MPVLNPGYLGSFQKINWIGPAIVGTVNPFILENISQKQINVLSPKNMIQGSLGVRIMDVGEIYWDTSINSTIILSNSNFGNIFTLIKDRWDKIQNLSKTGELTNFNTPILTKASITVNKDAVSCSLDLISEQSYFNIEKGPIPDFTARVAKWYDCTLTLAGLPGSFPNFASSINFPVESASINLESTVNRRFFINVGQTPYFSLESYKVSGTFTILATASDILGVDLINPQTLKLTLTGPSSLSLSIAGAGEISFGLTSMESQVESVVKAGDVNKITFSFTSFTS